MKKAETCRCYDCLIIFNCIHIMKVVLVCTKIIYILKSDLQGVIQHVIGVRCFGRLHLKCTAVR
jgi:hypothetical protein